MAEVVLSLMRARRLIPIILVTSIMLWVLGYCACIWPIFLKHDMTNPVIAEAILSDHFKESTQPLFDALRRYNADPRAGDRQLPGEFYFYQGWMGLMVSGHYRLVERVPVGTELRIDDADRVKQHYTYVPEFRIQRNDGLLICWASGVLLLSAALAYSLHKRPPAETRFFDQVLERYFNGDPVQAVEMPQPPLHETMADLLSRFHLFVRHLQAPVGERSSLKFDEEADVQHALHAILKLHGVIAIPEAVTPNHAGKSARMDFFLEEEGIAIEVKKTRKGLRDGALADQLILDIERYQQHDRCKHLICFVYDPLELLSDPRGLKRHLEAVVRRIGVTVVVSPMR